MSKVVSNSTARDNKAAKSQKVKIAKDVTPPQPGPTGDTTQVTERARRTLETREFREPLKKVCLEFLEGHHSEMPAGLTVLNVLKWILNHPETPQDPKWTLLDLDSKARQHQQYHTVNYCLNRFLKDEKVTKSKIQRGKSTLTVWGGVDSK